MNITDQEMNELKTAIIEAARKAPQEFAEMMKEVSAELKAPEVTSRHEVSPERIKLMEDIFAEYDDVFRALA